MKRLRAAGVLAALLSSGTFGAEALFSSHQSIEAALTRSIDHSQQSIDVAVYDLASPILAAALIRAAGRGVRVRVLTDASGRLPPSLRDPFLMSLEVRALRGRSRVSGAMHHKFAVFDAERLVTGSYNWTRGARWANYENALFEEDLTLVRAFSEEFERLWRRGRPMKTRQRIYEKRRD
jgi:mitochondrial cardiolipin hydrolase